MEERRQLEENVQRPRSKTVQLTHVEVSEDILAIIQAFSLAFPQNCHRCKDLCASNLILR